MVVPFGVPRSLDGVYLRLLFLRRVLSRGPDAFRRILELSGDLASANTLDGYHDLQQALHAAAAPGMRGEVRLAQHSLGYMIRIGRKNEIVACAKRTEGRISASRHMVSRGKGPAERHSDRGPRIPAKKQEDGHHPVQRGCER